MGEGKPISYRENNSGLIFTPFRHCRQMLHREPTRPTIGLSIRYLRHLEKLENRRYFEVNLPAFFRLLECEMAGLNWLENESSLPRPTRGAGKSG
jgi:hypothetical protein